MSQHKGWFMASIGTVCTGFQASATVTFGVVLYEVSKEFPEDLDILSLAVSSALAVAGITAPFVGRLMDLYPIRILLSCGALSLVLGWLALSTVNSVYLFVLCYGLFFGPAGALLSPMVSAKLMTRWFDRKLGLSLSIVSLPLGNAVFPLIAFYLIQAFDWHGMAVAMSGLSLLLLLLIQLIQESPGNAAKIQVTDSNENEPKQLISYRELLTDKGFLVTAICSALMMATPVVVFTHLVLHVTTKEIDAEQGAYLFSIIGTTALVATPIFGWLVDRVGSASILMLCAISMGLTLLILFQDLAGFAYWVAAAAAMGLAMGGLFPSMSGTLHRLVGGTSFGTAIGVADAMILGNAALAPFLASVVIVQGGTYSIFSLAYLVVISVFTLLIWSWVKPRLAEQK